MRSLIPYSQDATSRLKLLHEIHAMVRTVLKLHKDEVQASSKPLTAPHFVRGDNLSVVTKNLFMRGHPNRKLRDRQLGPFTSEEQLGKHVYKLLLPSTFRLHPAFYVNNLRTLSAASLRHAVTLTTLEGDGEEFDVSHILVVCIKSLLGR
jgi:hypothetical protein